MSDNPSDPLVNKDKMRIVADEMNVGGHFDGGSRRIIGNDQDVVVDLFRRRVGPDAGTYFLRVSLRSMIQRNLHTTYEIDLDKYSTENEFLNMVEIGGGAIAEADCDKRGATWDCEWVARQARAAAVELLHEIETQK